MTFIKISCHACSSGCATSCYPCVTACSALTAVTGKPRWLLPPVPISARTADSLSHSSRKGIVKTLHCTPNFTTSKVWLGPELLVSMSVIVCLCVYMHTMYINLFRSHARANAPNSPLAAVAPHDVHIIGLRDH